MDIIVHYHKNTYLGFIKLFNMFSKACEYGIRTSICIAEQSQLDRKVSLKEISSAIESPVAYTTKILQILCRNTILHSGKGPNCGFSINKDELDRIKLSTIVMAIDGSGVYMGCALGLSICNEKEPCPIHKHFKTIRNNLKLMLESTTL